MTIEIIDDRALSVLAICNRIKPHLAGQEPEIQGAVLCDLLALWLAGHHPDMRETLLRHHVDNVRLLTTVNEKELFGDGGFPVGHS